MKKFWILFLTTIHFKTYINLANTIKHNDGLLGKFNFYYFSKSPIAKFYDYYKSNLRPFRRTNNEIFVLFQS